MKRPATALLLALASCTALAAAPSGKATAALETLLACKAGSDFTQAQAEKALQAAGLTHVPGGVFEAKGGNVALFGGTVDSANVDIAPGGSKSLHVYLKDVAADQVGRHLSVTTVNEDAETEAPSYIRKVDEKHTLHVGAADDYEGYSAAVTCQIAG
ncbi:TPA: hypothetical protein QDZ34_004426 [Stenotrophomonas maltophilia]|nr:hypothetical protein [Stenotrophomonas maltophilia]HDS0951734.1 hypothetical protein [Stenotrophomonas maltophilia]HDS1026269.1 hypothetical protein [Stenotrophomonas maltophilia]HDS1030249.1 hypothetical protein [Stenotrophomonas maltophilia]HDS1032613.1 hypothetical protein [Stenotrophomonas maltophilia]